MISIIIARMLLLLSSWLVYYNTLNYIARGKKNNWESPLRDCEVILANEEKCVIIDAQVSKEN